MRKILLYFIKYPVAVNIFILAFIIFGLLGINSLKSSFFPLSPAETLRINLTYPGASPEEMEEGIVLKIEDNLKGIVGVDRVTSISRENTATITVEIEKGKNIDVVLSDVKNAVDRVPSFPAGMEPPVIAKLENLAETISFTVSGEGLPLHSLKQYARKIENDIRGMEGISQLTMTGFPDEEIAITLRETALRSYKLTFQEVAQAVANSNLLISGGNIKTKEEDYLIRARNKFYQGEALRNIVVKSDPSGNIIRLDDIASVKDTWSENPDRIYFNEAVAINVAINNTNSEDMIATATLIREYINDFNQQYENIQLNIANDNSIVLIQRTKLLLENGFIGVLLVLLFLSLFLNPKLAFWVAAGLPISFFGMFIFAPMIGITINVLSLFGMIIVIGILVDDGIVIGENIYHHYEKGKKPIQAAIDGTLEVIPPIVSAILTTLLAFSTFFFLDGDVGDFFSEVSEVVTITLLISLIEALIILPAHIAHSGALVKRTKKETRLSAFFKKINNRSEKFLFYIRDQYYAPSLRFFLENKLLGFSIPITLLILTLGCINAGIIKMDFFPRISSDRVSIRLQMPQGTNERITDSIISVIEDVAWEVNEVYTPKQTGQQSVVENIVKRIGPGTSNASLMVNLLPGELRDFSAPEISNAIQEKAGSFYGTESLTFGSGGNFGGSPVAISLLGNNIQELKAAKVALKTALTSRPDLKDIADNDPQGIKEIQIKLKEKAYLLGLNLRSVMSQVRNGFFGYQAQRFQRGQDEIKVWVRYDKENRKSIKHLDDMWLTTPGGQQVPFSEIADYSINRGEIAINHLQGKREIQVTADLKDPKNSSAEILAQIKANSVPEILSIYPSVSVLYEGQNREASRTAGSAAKVFPIILLLIYLTIAFTFRSYDQPLLLLIMIPFSLIGVAWGHWLFGFSINILSALGIIALIGILVNDGLVLIEKLNANLRSGFGYNQALYKAGISRFRAIFLTSITTIAGLAPLMLEKSRQAQFLKPMAISISAGIAVATVLTLIMLPLLLSLGNSVKVGIKWLRTGEKVNKEDVERAIIEQKSVHDATH